MSAPDVIKQIQRKARKTHSCCECRTAINPGDTYVVVSGVWDGRGASFKQCPECNQLMDNLISRCIDAGIEPEDGPCFEGLREFVEEQQRESGDVSIRHLRRLGLEHLTPEIEEV